MLKTLYRTLFLLPLFMALLLLLGPTAGWSRDNSLTAELALRQEYDSNIFLQDRNEQSGWYTTIAPGFRLESRAPLNRVLLSYSPGLKRNHDQGSQQVDHDFLLLGTMEPSPRWQLEGFNRYYLADDNDYRGTPLPDIDQQLSARLERRRLARNTFSLRGKYSFAPEGTLTLAYENRLLDHRTGTGDDYVRHHPSVILDWPLASQWLLRAGYGYIRGEFDQADDLTTHTADLRAQYRLSPTQNLFVAYGLNHSTYQGVSPDYRIHRFTGGWNMLWDQRTTLTAELGLVALDRQQHDNSQDITFALTIDRRWQRGYLSLSGRGGVDQMQFSGGDEDDLSRYRQLQLNGRYRLAERLGADLGFSVRENDFAALAGGAGKERIYQFNSGLAWAFSRHYEAALRYLYKELHVAEPGTGSYRDHRVFLELRAAWDLWKW